MRKGKRRSKAERRTINRHRDLAKRRAKYVDALLGKTQRTPQLLSKLKREPLAEIRRILDIVADQPSALARRVGRLFPPTYDAISHTLGMPFTGELDAELAWELCVLSRHAERINTFLVSKREFERLLLLGQYDKAGELLSEITQIVGCSLWSADARVVISEYSKGLAANREFVESLGERLQNKNVLVHATFYSQRAEKNVSTANYDENVQKALGKALVSRNIAGIAAKVFFGTNFARFDRYDQLADVIYYGTPYPLVDRYLTFVRVLQVTACHANRPLAPSVAAVVRMAARLFCDSRVHLLWCLVDPEARVVRTELGDVLAEITHHYTAGEYDKAAKIAKQGLGQCPECFEFYELYAKCKLHLEQELHNPLPENSMARDLLGNVYDVLKKDGDTRKAFEFLRKMTYVLDSTRLASQLFAFLGETSVTVTGLNCTLFGGINGTAASARLATCFRDAADGLRFLNRLRTQYPSNNAVDFFCGVLRRHEMEPEGEASFEVPLARRLKYRALLRLQAGDHRGAIAEYEKLRAKAAGKMPFLEDVVRGLFAGYIGAGMYEECVRLVVDTYLFNKDLLAAIRLRDCLDMLGDYGRCKSPSEICWPIFYSICEREGLLADGLWGVYVQYDEFLSSYEVMRPSQLLGTIGDHERARLVYFLRYICVLEIMDNSPLAFATSKELEDERIGLCQALQELDSENAEDYSREIHELMRKGMIRESIRDVDKSKVYIDTGGVARSLSSLCRERFERSLLFAYLDERLRRTPALRQVLSEADATRILVWTGGSCQVE